MNKFKKHIITIISLILVCSCATACNQQVVDNNVPTMTSTFNSPPISSASPLYAWVLYDEFDGDYDIDSLLNELDKNNIFVKWSDFSNSYAILKKGVHSRVDLITLESVSDAILEYQVLLNGKINEKCLPSYPTYSFIRKNLALPEQINAATVFTGFRSVLSRTEFVKRTPRAIAAGITYAGDAVKAAAIRGIGAARILVGIVGIQRVVMQDNCRKLLDGFRTVGIFTGNFKYRHTGGRNFNAFKTAG